MKRSKHKCDAFESMWKVDSTGKLKCVCRDEQQPVVDAVAGRDKEHYYVPGPPNPSALTDRHPAGRADTSVEAFERTNRARGQVQVEHLIRASASGLTAEEAADAMGVGQATTSARFNELKQAGMLERSGRRQTRSGRSAGVWRLKKGM